MQRDDDGPHGGQGCLMGGALAIIALVGVICLIWAIAWLAS